MPAVTDESVQFLLSIITHLQENGGKVCQCTHLGIVTARSKLKTFDHQVDWKVLGAQMGLKPGTASMRLTRLKAQAAKATTDNADASAVTLSPSKSKADKSTKAAEIAANMGDGNGSDESKAVAHAKNTAAVANESKKRKYAHVEDAEDEAFY